MNRKGNTREDETSRTLYVKINKSRPPNDLSAITNEHFREHFQYFEDAIQRCNVVFHHDTGLPKGFGFVTFKSRSSASRAMDYFQGSMLGRRHKLDISFKLQKQASKPHHSLDKESTPNAKPIALDTNSDTIIEFKDEVVGLMMQDESGPLRAVASREGVELCPLLAPHLGFQMKGEPKKIEVVRNYCNQLQATLEQTSIGYEQLILSNFCQPIWDTLEVDRCACSLKKSLNVVCTCSFEQRLMCQVGLLVTQNHVTFIRIVVGDLWTEQAEAIVIPTGRAMADNQHSYPIELPSLAGKFKRLNNTTRELVEVGDTVSLDGGKLPCFYIIQALYPLSIQKSADDESCDLLICNSLSHAMEKNIGSIAFPGIKIQFIKSIFDALRFFGPTSLHTVTVVLETKFELQNYVTALNKLYAQEGREEGCAKATNSSITSSAKNAVAQSCVPWKYRDDFGHFMPYSPADSIKIEAMFQRRDQSSHIIIQKKTYRFDFRLMKQINIHTGHDRDVQRVASPPSPDIQVVKSKSVFLPGDKVVINLKGPRENLAEAKQQLEKKIMPLVFSKMIPLPANVPTSLHQQLLNIAKKHRISCTTVEGTASGAGNVYQHAVKLEGLERCVRDALTEAQELILQFQASATQLPRTVDSDQGSQYPQEWDPMSISDKVKLVHLPVLAECERVAKKLQETMSNSYIIKVERVQNKELWRRYVQCMSRMHEKNAGRVNEKHLFHGTRGELAERICKSEEGFDMRFSREGMWGKANYFAADASYSDAYAYHNRINGTHELILAKVLTGDSYYSRSNSTLRMPPEKQQHSTGENQLQQVRYDSVNGETRASVVYMTYSNDRAYPAYIVTYSRREPAEYDHPPEDLALSGNPQAASSQPQAETEQPAPPPPLVETAKQAAKQIAASIAFQVRKKAPNKDKCKVS